MSTEAAKPNWKNIISEIRKPTNAGTRLIKGSIIAITIGLTYYKVIKPTVTELKFYREQNFANALYELEVKEKEKNSET